MARRGPGGPGIIIGGAGLLTAGVWLVASGLGLPLLGFAQVWPLMLFLLGLTLIAGHASQPSGRGLLLLGLPLLLTGLFLCAFTFQLGNLTWADMARYWPIFALIAGLTLLIVYVSGGLQEAPLLLLTYLFGGFGLAALPLTLGLLQGTVFGQVARLWPLLLIVLVLAVVLRLRMSHSNEAR